MDNQPFSGPGVSSQQLGASPQQVVYQGLRIQLTPAPIGKRILAYAIDLGIIMAILYPLFIIFMIVAITIMGLTAAGIGILKMNGGSGLGTLLGVGAILLLVFLLLLLIQHYYFVYNEVKRGTTPGKRLFGLKVVSLDGSALTLGQAVLRDLMRYVDCILVIPGLTSMLLNENRRRLGDFLANTLVVHSESKERSAQYLYCGAEDYQVLIRQIQLGDIPQDTQTAYLTFAFRWFVSDPKSVSAPEVEQWNAKITQLMGEAANQFQSEDQRMRFFAEYCYQRAQGR